MTATGPGNVAPLEPAASAALLAEVLEAARGAGAVVVFDLDSTLLDNRPRQARILREYGGEHGLAALARCAAEHWNGWDCRVAMRNAGMTEAEAEHHDAPFRAYWGARFFTSEYCVDDRPLAGAVDYVGAVKATGALIAYVTGRHEAMRAGTVTCLGQHAIATPDGARIRLLMKPSLEEHDDLYKERTYLTLNALGRVVAAFDNEPTHINGYRRVFSDAICVHLATDHSMRDVAVQPGIPSIRDFSR